MAKKNWLVVIVVVLFLALTGLVVKAKFFGKPGPAALQISTTPRATVFIDDIQAGITPFFDDKLEAGERVIKLVPEATADGLVTWEGRVKLTANILTVVNRNFGRSENDSSGETISLEKIVSRDKASLTVISTPDQAVVKLNGEPKGFSPVSVEDLTPGDYKVTVAAPGFAERDVSARTIAGYKLIVNAQLAQEIEGIVEATESAELEQEKLPTPSPKVTPKAAAEPPDKPYVKIKSTPTGWLRVRMGPTTAATEAAKIYPDETYPYLEEEENGWYKIEYESGEEGWVSGTYADLIE